MEGTPMTVIPEVMPEIESNVAVISNVSGALTKLFTPNPRAETIVEEAARLAVSDDASYSAAATLLNDVVKAERGRVDSFFDPLCLVFDKLHKGFTSMRGLHRGPWDDAETKIKRKMSDHLIAQRQRAERDRLAAEAAERKRLEDERVDDAIAVADAGDRAQAEAMLEMPIAAPVMHTPPAAPKVAGVKTSDVWVIDEAHIDFDALFEFCSTPEGKPFRAMFLQANVSGLKAAAKQLKSNFPKCGVPCGPTVNVAGKRGK
jgi:hypothetical protein